MIVRPKLSNKIEAFQIQFLIEIFYDEDSHLPDWVQEKFDDGTIRFYKDKVMLVDHGDATHHRPQDWLLKTDGETFIVLREEYFNEHYEIVGSS